MQKLRENDAKTSDPASPVNAALVEAQADRLACGVEILRAAIKVPSDLSTVQALIQAALDFLTSDEEALAEGRAWQPTDVEVSDWEAGRAALAQTSSTKGEVSDGGEP